jgi:hypothetical protein
MFKAAAGQFLPGNWPGTPVLPGWVEHGAQLPAAKLAILALSRLEQGDRACLGGPAADVEVELDGQVGLAECLPGMGEGFGFYAAVQGVQVG